MEYFEVSDYKSTSTKYVFYIRELNVIPTGYEREHLESKGFYQEETVTDFPLRGKRCEYKVKRRRWLNKQDGSIAKRDWNLLAKRLSDDN